MAILTQIITLSIYLSSTCVYEIVALSENPTAVEGNPIELFCRVKAKQDNENGNWKTCEWRRQRDGEQCAYEYTYPKLDVKNGWKVESTCTNLTQDLAFHGSKGLEEGANEDCGIKIHSVKQVDYGNWTCELEQCDARCHEGNGNKAEAIINLQVIN